MSDVVSTLVIAALCLAGAFIGVTVVRLLRRRRRRSLRAKLGAFVVGMIGVEGAILPALIATVAGETMFGWRSSWLDHWTVVAAYVGLTAYAVVRLFPWREVEAMAADPEARLRDVIARVLSADRDGDAR